jgi:hypothetical protein
MKSTTLFMLGGIALLLSTLLVAIQDLQYFVSGAQLSTVALWVGILADALRVLGLVALFARQAQRGGMLGLIGYILLTWGVIAAVGFEAVQLGVAAGAVTNAQLAQVSSYDLGNTLLIAFLVAGEILFGVSIYLAGVYPKFAGALLALVGILHYLTGPVAFTRPIYALLSVVAYAWLGWLLITNRRAMAQEAAPDLNTQGRSGERPGTFD